MSIREKLLNTGIKVFKGNPKIPLASPALFLGITTQDRGGFAGDVVASLTMVRPSADKYEIKELIADMELGPEAAMEKAIDIARRGEIRLIFINADLDKLSRKLPQSA